jgi:hypothetical protein
MGTIIKSSMAKDDAPVKHNLQVLVAIEIEKGRHVIQDRFAQSQIQKRHSATLPSQKAFRSFSLSGVKRVLGLEVCIQWGVTYVLWEPRRNGGFVKTHFRTLYQIMPHPSDEIAVPLRFFL